MRTLIATLLCLFIVERANSQTIAQVRQQAVGSTVTVRGIVTNGSELGPIRYIQDNTGGIALYGSNLNSVQRGDSIVATGTLTDYNNLLEVQPVTSFNVYTPTGPLPVPQIITPIQVDETVEGELVTLSQVTFTNGGSPIAGNNSYTFTAGVETGVIYVRNGSPLVGYMLPLWPVDITAIASQFYTTYQLLPRDTFDFVTTSSIVMTTPVVQSNMTQNGFDLGWTTNISGSTFVRYGRTPALELGIVNGAPGVSHTATLTGAPSDIFFAQAFSVNGTDTAASSIRSYATVSASAGWIQVYFNKSVDTTFSSGTNAEMAYYALDDTLIAYIDRAQRSIDFTIYHWDNANISNISAALNNAYGRGVDVRIIVDGSYVHPAVTQLDPNIPVLYSPVGGNYNIMHNKFVVFDAESSDPNDAIVWTGSTNFSDGQINIDPNHVIIFQDQSMAKGFTIEFEEMWGDTGLVPDTNASRFGPYKINNTPHEYLVGGIRVEQYFSPSDGTNAQIDEAILSGDVAICVATMLITRTDLAADLVAQSTSGVQTYVMVDDAANTTTYATLQAGLPANQLVDYSNGGIMHHKYMIVDPNTTSSDPQVLTGSHNWSTSAETRNDENTVIVHDAVIANIFYQEFVPRFTQNGGVIIGVENHAAQNSSINAYPNPAGDVLNVTYSGSASEEVTCTLIDATGRVINAETKAAGGTTVMFTFNTSGLSGGMYFVQVAGNAGCSTQTVIIE